METFTYFWRGPFSQWYPRPFTVDGVEYSHAEQFMMASKARFFGDTATLEKIMQSPDPKSQKQLGRAVTPFDKAQWDAVARDIVYKGNYHKFSQHQDLKNALLATAGTTLVEASPFDDIWGIKLEETHPLALKRETWNGLNWLGEVLTKVREDFMEGVQTTENFNWTP